jgi:hypothetical protein
MSWILCQVTLFKPLKHSGYYKYHLIWNQTLQLDVKNDDLLCLLVINTIISLNIKTAGYSLYRKHAVLCEVGRECVDNIYIILKPQLIR